MSDPVEVIHTVDELLALCVEWQERLRLQDWRIGLTIARARDFENDRKEAEITMMDMLKEARIKILNPVDYPATCWLPQDMEEALVHELLHIHFLPFGDCEVAEEAAINCISQALVNAKRGEKINV